MPTYRPNKGRHENGQNYLVNETTIGRIVDLVPVSASVPVIEIGPGQGALTFPLQKRVLGGGGTLTAVEIDASTVRWLENRLDREVHLYEQDFLDFTLPRGPHTLVGNLPFHLTTAMLRHILHSPGWEQAVLLLQWEVARRRAGVGGATMMTAQWWPWVDFGLHGRVPSTHFRPRPTVDAGILMMRRRGDPLVDVSERPRYASFVHDVFTGKGRGIAEIVPRVVGRRRARGCSDALREIGVPEHALPKQLDAEQWAALFTTLCLRGR
ncbi:MAG: 23S ribosomal RNA methyltransferase Erm [Mycobacteriaceae bacterium]